MKILLATALIILGYTANAQPVANAGPNQTIYLTQTSNATLDGSASSGDSYQWTDVSTDYKSGANITSPNSSVTTVTGLKQGVWYFQLAVTSDGNITMDTVVIKVDYDTPPANGTLIHHFNFVDNASVIDKRDDTTTFFSVSNHEYSQTNGDSNGDDWFYFRDRTNGLYIDQEKAKLVTTIEDGYQGDAGYARGEVALADYSFTIDTMHTYVFEWKGYYPQDINYLVSQPSWHSILNMFQIHSYKQTATVYSYGVTADDSVHVSDTYDDGTGKLQTYQKYVSSRRNFYDKAHTIRVTVREGKGYAGQTAFIKSEIDGVTNYYRNRGQVGSSYFDDFVKFGGLYDYNHFVVNVDSLSRGRKFKLVTEAFNIYVLDNSQSPTANAGSNQTISLPNSKVTLAGNGKDQDGMIFSYQWTQLSGPSNGIINNANSASTTVTDLIQGIYEFELKVTDDKGAIGKDTVEITVNPEKNITPSADAGADQSITLPTNNTILYGSGNDADGTIAAYSWEKISGPSDGSVEKPSSSFTNVSGLSEGIYQFELTVTDDKGAIGKDTVQVNIIQPQNIAPVANAGADQTITLPTNNIILYGAGNDAGDISGYAWAKISGPSEGSIKQPSSAITNVTGLSEGVYQFELTLTDNEGAIGKDTIEITVNAATNLAPKADAGINQSITLPTNSTILYGSGNDADGTITNYSWAKISGPSEGLIESPSAPFTNISELSEGTYEFELTVTDNNGTPGKDTVEIIINREENIAPTADAGTNQTVTLPTNNVTLSGSGSDEDETIVSYKWNTISGPGSEAINNADSSLASVVGLIQGVYQFELTVTDDEGAIGKDTVDITVNPAENIVPTANAGINQTITLPINNAALSGNGNDLDGTITGYLWTKLSGPNSEAINNPNSASTTITNLVQGIYQFELSVTDNKGDVGKDTVEVIVNAANNIAPTAKAGVNQTITLPANSVTLIGSGNDVDGTVANYSWAKISGPSEGTIENSSLASTDISGLSEGIYQFEFTVTDDKGDVGRDTVQIIVKSAANIPPTADAGIDQTIKLPTNNITLSGKGSDSDGTVSSYSWKKISGPAGSSIENAASSVTDVTGLKKGVYKFELTITDNKNAIGKDSVEITVNPADNIAPIANAGSNQSITMPRNGAILFGSGSDADGKISVYTWSKISGPSGGTIIYPNLAFTIITGLEQGDYQFELAVTDNNGAIGKDTVEVIVNAAKNIAPTVQAEDDQTITLPISSTSLSGNGNDVDGTIAAYLWTKISGPSDGTVDNPSSFFTKVTGLSEGVYQFELTVTDDKGATAKDTVKITVNPAVNIAPLANAGANQTITLPRNGVILFGNGRDVDGSITGYFWTKISGPASGTINNVDSEFTVVTGLIEGVYQFELIVTDDKGAIGKDTIAITVKPAKNIPPDANAGSNQAITLPKNNIDLSGSGRDVDGTIASYKWRKISGPSTFNINNPTSAIATATELVQGSYQFELTVTDNKEAIGKDTVEVIVNAANNVAPAANAGAGKTITLPSNSIILSGSGSDADGTIVSYKWTKISGPSDFSFNNSSSAIATVSKLVQGIYEFELTVTDNKGAIGKSTVKVTVNSASNIAPTTSAGTNQTVTLPENSVILSGSGKDSDGTIVSYRWIKKSGPSDFSLNNSSSATATASGLVEGTYEFELTVTDNKGAVGKSTVEITVIPAHNIEPTANAGIDQTIILPVNNVTLSGSGQDTDGKIASYHWVKISGPDSETINNPNSSSTIISGLVKANYQFELTVTDNKGAKGKDTVLIKVDAADNIAPTANAGKDTTILSPASTVALNGTAIDSDGEIVDYSWKQISGPSQSIILSGNTQTTDINALTEGTYNFELTVTDDKGAIGRDTVNVTVALARLAPQINNTIKVYPNPVHYFTTADINTGRPNTNVLMTITDMSGRIVYKKQFVSQNDNVKEIINMSNFSKGTYVITLYFDNIERKAIKVLKL